MAVRQADNALIDRMITERDNLRVLEADLRRFGDRESADIVKRAYRELMLPSFTGVANKAGRPH